MRKSSLLLLPAILFLSCKPLLKGKFHEEEDGPREAHERDFKMMRDPQLNMVPTERLTAAKLYRDNLLKPGVPNAAITGINWVQLGPKNQGGRTRSLLVDANDATGKTVWAGSVGGGLWKTTDITVASPAWTATNDFFGNLAISSIAQDPSNTLIMYFCTGETGYFNGDAIQGLGVWKTTDGGTTWNQLASTNNSNFYACQKLAVTSTGVVMVATSTGLRRSTDGGATWTKVLGTGLGITGATSNLCYDVDIAANGDVYATLYGTIHKSTTGGATWSAAQTLPISASRIEVACAASDANYVYALVENGNVVNGILRSTNGGGAWTSRTEPADADPGIPAADFSRTQAWYDLTITVDPNNRDVLMVGGVDIFKSADGAGTWTQLTHWYGGFSFPYVHADQHFMIYAPGSSSIAYFSNDGGVYRATGINGTPSFSDKGTGYVTAQFYSCAIHPTAYTSYFLAGAQDNGSHQFSSGSLQNTIEVTGGDGAFCHIDQDQPQYQWTSYVYNDFYRSTDGGSTWTNISTTGGDFISPTDYDDLNNRMYMNNTAGTYRRWDNPQSGNTFAAVTVAAFGGGNVSAVRVSPNTSNRVFFGLDNGRVVKVDNANTATPTATNISTGLPAAYVTCVEVETGNDNHLVVTYSNYGVNSIWESTDGGTSWTSIEGNLPDMPVRWALLNPNNNDQLVIATELGVWSTDNINAGATSWGTSSSGLANVRVDMLQYRSSDKLLIAATHGRGLFSSDAFTTPTALFSASELVVYKGHPVQFTSSSYRATSWSWDFGDGNTSAAQHPVHAYTTAGQYTISLSINGGASTLTKNLYVQVLPNRGTPYNLATGGNFDVNPLEFGADKAAGTSWERGSSAVAGKNGTNSGSFAWVTGLTGNYADNSDSWLMTPNYNFSAAGLYQLRFRARFSTESGYDGFRVEYTLDSGSTWLPLGTSTGAGWYNFANGVGDASFPVNEAFFSGSASASFILYTNSTDASALAGNPSVGFRFRFKSDGSVNAAGVALDDFEIFGPVNVALALTLHSFTAERHEEDVQLQWHTENEINNNRFEIERSYDGINFSSVGTVNARNTVAGDYVYTDRQAVTTAAIRSGFIVYRLKMIDNAGNYKYSDNARVLINNNQPAISIGPNPFTGYIRVTTRETLKAVTLYDMQGKPVYSTRQVADNRINIGHRLPAGTYIIKVETATQTITRKITCQ